MINNNMEEKPKRYAMRNAGQLTTKSKSSSVLLRTVSKEALPISSSGGGASRSTSSLISRNSGVREIPGHQMGLAEGGSGVRGAALRRIGGGDSGASATTLERSPIVNKGASSFDRELAPDVDVGNVDDEVVGVLGRS